MTDLSQLICNLPAVICSWSLSLSMCILGILQSRWELIVCQKLMKQKMIRARCQTKQTKTDERHLWRKFYETFFCLEAAAVTEFLFLHKFLQQTILAGVAKIFCKLETYSEINFCMTAGDLGGALRGQNIVTQSSNYSLILLVRLETWNNKFANMSVRHWLTFQSKNVLELS